MTINTCGSSFDTLLGVYTGISVSALALVTDNNDNAACGVGSLQSQVQFNAVSGSNYQIAVDGYSGASGNITLQIFQQ